MCAVDRGPEVRIGLVSLVQPADLATGLEPRHRANGVGTRQPERRRERLAPGVERRVPNHQRVADRAPDDDLERGGRVASELLSYELDVGRAVLARHRTATCACARWRAGSRPGAPRFGA